LRFDHICRVNREVLESVNPQAGEVDSVEGLLVLDERARRRARQQIAALAAAV
jgi:1-deoxy-D-xylulose-5-phosphate reductoisomerase